MSEIAGIGVVGKQVGCLRHRIVSDPENSLTLQSGARCSRSRISLRQGEISHTVIGIQRLGLISRNCSRRRILGCQFGHTQTHQKQFFLNGVLFGSNRLTQVSSRFGEVAPLLKSLSQHHGRLGRRFHRIIFFGDLKEKFGTALRTGHQRNRLLEQLHILRSRFDTRT